jgi:hypothetical protein
MEKPPHVSERSVKPADRPLVSPGMGYRPECPTCASTHLLTKGAKGFSEHMAIFFTRKRKYRCLLCGHNFRAHPRDKAPRVSQPAAMPEEPPEETIAKTAPAPVPVAQAPAKPKRASVPSPEERARAIALLKKRAAARKSEPQG